jgi:hypothetical protein
MNMRDYPTQTQTQVREPLVLVRKDMDVNEHERLSNTDTNPSKRTTGIRIPVVPLLGFVSVLDSLSCSFTSISFLTNTSDSLTWVCVCVG